MDSSPSTITHSEHHLIKKLAFTTVLSLFLALLMGCNQDDNLQKPSIEAGKVVLNFKDYKTQSLATSNGKLIKVFIAENDQQQTQGLSGVKPEQLEDNEGMLFTYKERGPRRFWMPNTFIDLDIFFLDESFNILHVERKVPAHPGMEEPPVIARTPTVVAVHVLELKATSPLSKEIRVGEKLNLLK